MAGCWRAAVRRKGFQRSAAPWLRPPWWPRFALAVAGCVGKRMMNNIALWPTGAVPFGFVVPQLKVRNRRSLYAPAEPSSTTRRMTTCAALCARPRAGREPMDYHQLRRGMTAVFFTPSGARMAHLLVSQSESGLGDARTEAPEDDPD